MDRARPADRAGTLPTGRAALASARAAAHTSTLLASLRRGVLPATHNSMSAATTPNWFFPRQPDGIIDQLDHGIRVLLVDLLGPARRPPRHRRHRRGAARRPRPEARRRTATATVDQRAAAAERVRPDPAAGRGLPVPRPVRQLGSTRWLDNLRETKDWLGRATRPTSSPLFVEDGARRRTPPTSSATGRPAAPRLHPGRRARRQQLADPGPDGRVRQAPGRADGGPRRRGDGTRGCCRASAGSRTPRSSSARRPISPASPSRGRPTRRCSWSTTGSAIKRATVTNAGGRQCARRPPAPGRAVPAGRGYAAGTTSPRLLRPRRPARCDRHLNGFWLTGTNFTRLRGAVDGDPRQDVREGP